MQHYLHSIYHSVASDLIPLRTDSAFLSKGLLTVQEFIEAGDQLVFKCPSWSWAVGEEKEIKSYLPKDKQFLITKGVPCRCRVSALNSSAGDLKDTLEDGWCLSIGPGEEKEEKLHHNIEEDFEDLIICGTKVENNHAGVKDKVEEDKKDEEEEFSDMLSYDQGVIEEDEAVIHKKEETNGVLVTRTYDISITYDRYYQTPRIWLRGYNESGGILSPEEMFEDIMTDYAHKTVTIDPHPHNILYGPQGSIHPCMHGPTMKRIIDQLTSNGLHLRPDQYMFVFLKFIQGVIPTIEYDFTMNIE